MCVSLQIYLALYQNFLSLSETLTHEKTKACQIYCWSSYVRGMVKECKEFTQGYLLKQQEHVLAQLLSSENFDIIDVTCKSQQHF